MRLFNIITTFPVVNHHLIPDFCNVTAAWRHFVCLPLYFGKGTLGIRQRFLSCFRYIQRLLRILLLLLLFTEFSDLLNIYTSFLNDFLVLTREIDCVHLHHSSPLLHFMVKTVNMASQFLKIASEIIYLGSKTFFKVIFVISLAETCSELVFMGLVSWCYYVNNLQFIFCVTHLNFLP